MPSVLASGRRVSASPAGVGSTIQEGTSWDGTPSIAVLRTGRVVGWRLVGSTVVVNVGLLGGAVVFWMSGQSFEQFSGMTPEP